MCFPPCSGRQSSPALFPSPNPLPVPIRTTRCVCHENHLGPDCRPGVVLLSEQFAEWPTDPTFQASGLFYRDPTNYAVLSNSNLNTYVTDPQSVAQGAPGAYDMSPSPGYFAVEISGSVQVPLPASMSWTVQLDGQYDMVGLRIKAASGSAMQPTLSSKCKVRDRRPLCFNSVLLISNPGSGRSCCMGDVKALVYVVP